VRHPLLGHRRHGRLARGRRGAGAAGPARRHHRVRPAGHGRVDVDLRPGDVIVSVDGEPLATMSELVAEVRRRARRRGPLEIFRDGETFEVAVELGERPR
jgi:S1-C subfamily serine protease